MSYAHRQFNRDSCADANITGEMQLCVEVIKLGNIGLKE